MGIHPEFEVEPDEHELAIHYKTRLPDSKELIARLRAETNALVERAVQAARSGFKEYHQQLTTQLRILITDAIRSADSRKALNVSPQQHLETPLNPHPNGYRNIS